MEKLELQRALADSSRRVERLLERYELAEEAVKEAERKVKDRERELRLERMEKEALRELNSGLTVQLESERAANARLEAHIRQLQDLLQARTSVLS